MIETKFTIADIILIAGTRIALGAGLGLLLASRLNDDQRKAAGLALALVGGLTTIPLAMGVIGRTRTAEAQASRIRGGTQPSEIATSRRTSTTPRASRAS